MPLQKLGLYIHWPYCESKCPYCDFNSFVGKAADMGAMESTYLRELDRFFKLTSGHELQSIFFGGGTPSLMPPLLTEKLIAHAKSLWATTPDMEITLEANPSTAEAGRFEAFSKAGVNRLSLGIQSFYEEALTFLGRKHTAKEGIAAIQLAQNIFPRVSFDLIYARPGQTLSAWRDELDYALSLGTEHLSLYQLTIEQGTAFAPRYDRGEFYLPEEDLAADMFELTGDMCAAHGLFRYETSNHSHLGKESRHNLIYWNYEDYIGVGPGAHGRITQGEVKLATEQHKAPDIWVEKVLNRGAGDVRTHEIDQLNQAKEALMMGLRLTEGVNLSQHDLPFEDVMDQGGLTLLIEHNLLTCIDNTLKATPQGHLCLNGVLRKLLG